MQFQDMPNQINESMSTKGRSSLGQTTLQNIIIHALEMIR